MEARVDRDTCAASIIVYAEVIEYLKGSPRYLEHRLRLFDLLRVIHLYRPTLRILDRYADIRRHLRRPYGPGIIGDMDTLIAATALERNLIVVTPDSDFLRVPGLQVQMMDLRRRP
jgi:predicted nucleic acid-binding protein